MMNIPVLRLLAALFSGRAQKSRDEDDVRQFR
jgi:hypothetical protein